VSVLDRLFRYSPLRYLAAAAVGAALILLMLLRNGFTGVASWLDALTVAGAVLILLGLLGMTVHFGAFDIFGYSFSTLRGARRYRTLFDYGQAHQEKRSRNGWTFMPFITVGAVILLCGIAVGALR